MVVKRQKKCGKFRGSTKHGWGAKKKHRGGGHRGGRGNAGLMKHKKSWMVKFDPDHFGKKGFFSMGRKNVKAINLKQVDELARQTGKIEIDIAEYGYNKLLSTGKLTHKIRIKAQSYSKKTKEKVKEMGGTLFGAEKNGSE